MHVGARVAGLVWGGYAESIVAKEEAWAEVPESMDLVDAAAFPLVTLTGSELIEEGARPRTGDTILITGAVGNVGRSAVYTAKAQGATVWAGVRSSQKATAASLGVEGIVKPLAIRPRSHCATLKQPHVRLEDRARRLVARFCDSPLAILKKLDVGEVISVAITF